MKRAAFRSLITLILACAGVLATTVCWAEEAKPVERVEILFRAGDYAQAMPLYQQQLAVNQDDPEVCAHGLFQIGQCLTGLQRYKEAIQEFDQLLESFPLSSSAEAALLRKGCVQAGVLKKTQDGIESWSTLIKNYPRSPLVPEACFYMGMVEWVHGHKQAARESWRLLVREYPQHPRTALVKLYLREE